MEQDIEEILKQLKEISLMLSAILNEIRFIAKYK